MSLLQDSGVPGTQSASERVMLCLEKEESCFAGVKVYNGSGGNSIV